MPCSLADVVEFLPTICQTLRRRWSRDSAWRHDLFSCTNDDLEMSTICKTLMMWYLVALAMKCHNIMLLHGGRNDHSAFVNYFHFAWNDWTWCLCTNYWAAFDQRTEHDVIGNEHSCCIFCLYLCVFVSVFVCFCVCICVAIMTATQNVGCECRGARWAAPCLVISRPHQCLTFSLVAATRLLSTPQ